MMFPGQNPKEERARKEGMMPAPPPPPPPRRPLPRLLFAAAVVLLGLAAIVSFRHFRAEVLGEAADDQPFHAELVHLADAPDGRPPLLIPEAGALESGVIVRRRLEGIRFQPSVPAVGSVVDVVDLAETRDTLAAAQSAAGQARADPELARAASGVARQRREVALALYGPAIADWMQSGSPELDQILQYHASLLLLTPLPGFNAVSLPAEAVVTDRHGKLARARLVSVVFRTDLRLRSLSALYRTEDAPTDLRFVPGPALSARLLVGPELAGVVAPASAVLQHDGKSWVYVEESPGRFRRCEISLAQALPDGSGWFQDRALRAGQTVVTAGGALLLGEER